MASFDPGETPAYIYRLDEVRRACRLLRAGLPAPSRQFYSLKANPHPAIVRQLWELGCHAEVSSPGELAAAMAAGVPGDEILYTGPGKRDADLTAALKAGVEWFSVDSPFGLDQLDRAAAALGTPARCLLRVNQPAVAPGQGLAMTGGASQFGADTAWVATQPERFRARDAATLVGLHLYLGSNLPDVAALRAQFATAITTARQLADRLDLDLRLLDLGGGFGAPFARAGDLPDLTGLADGVAAELDAAFPGWRRGTPLVAFESGRFLASTCGSLLVRVLDVKRSHDRTVVVLESGINHLGGMSGLRRLPPLVPELHSVAAGPDPRPALTGAIITGPLCTPLDTWARDATLPAVHPGELLRVPNVGAYGLYASLLAFLGHPAPRELVVDGDQVVHVSQLELIRRPYQTEE